MADARRLGVPVPVPRRRAAIPSFGARGLCPGGVQFRDDGRFATRAPRAPHEIPMPATQNQITNLHTLLTDYAWNNVLGKAEIMALTLDMQTYCLDGKWDDFDDHYKGAWQGEIVRRIGNAIPNGATVLGTVEGSNKKTRTVTQAATLGAFSVGAQPIAGLLFSQFTINRHFQGHYDGQPDWLSGKEVLDVARALRLTPALSSDLRIRAYRHAGQWVALNNRGFALHSLANVVPRRIVFDTRLSSDEEDRLGRNFAALGLNLAESLPVSRRRKQEWDAEIPSQFTGVPETRNSSKVVYSIKAITMAGGAPDHGNEDVMNSAL